MQQPSSSKKPLIIIVVIIVIGGLAYFYFSGTPQDTSSTVVSADGSVQDDASIVGTRVLTLLNQISSLHIDPTLFKTEMYASLVDHTVPIYEQNVGKDNPFYYTPSAKK